MAVEALKCKECSTEYPLEALYVCDKCFGPLEVAYDFSDLDPAETRRKIQAGPRSIWRYADFLPFERRPRTALDAGTTPLVRADRLAAELGIAEVWVKNDAANPTHSFKDRVVNVALAKARELGYEVVACASTGNLANAVAAHAAAAGLESYVFVPADLEEQKILATGVYGANVVAVNGNYDDVNKLCTELSHERPWAFVNVNVRPVLRRGLEDARLRDRRAARLRAARPGGRAGGVRLAVHEDRARLRGVDRGRPAARARCPPSTAHRPRAAPRSPRRSRPAGTSASP